MQSRAWLLLARGTRLHGLMACSTLSSIAGDYMHWVENTTAEDGGTRGPSQLQSPDSWQPVPLSGLCACACAICINAGHQSCPAMATPRDCIAGGRQLCSLPALAFNGQRCGAPPIVRPTHNFPLRSRSCDHEHGTLHALRAGCPSGGACHAVLVDGDLPPQDAQNIANLTGLAQQVKCVSQAYPDPL